MKRQDSLPTVGWIALALALGLTGLLSGCGALAYFNGHSSNGPYPSWGFLSATVAAPPTMVAGQTVSFTAQVTGGTPPYTVAWDLGGGATQNPAPATNQPATSAATATMVAGDWFAKVTVTDSLGVTFTTPAPGVAYHVSAGP